MRCPGLEALQAFVELELEPGVEREVRAHLGQCRDCDSEIARLDPSWMFARLPRHTMPDREWSDVLRVVRQEVAASPRRSWSAIVSRSLGIGRLAPVAAALAGLALLAVLTLRPADQDPVSTVSPVAADDPLVAILATAVTAPTVSAVASGFVYRSNPLAQVAEISVAGDGIEPVLITMVVDDTLADLF